VRFCVFLCVCVCCDIFIVIVRVCSRFAVHSRASAKFLKNTRRFGAFIRRRVRDFENLARSRFRFYIIFFFVYRLAAAGLHSSGAVCYFRPLIICLLLNFCLFIDRTPGGPSDPNTLNININNNNKYHASRAGVNNRQVGHRASAKKFLLFTERDILRCSVYRSAKRSVYTNFMFAIFWPGKMVPGWLGLIVNQPISAVSCGVSVTWTTTALVDYFICRFYHLTFYVVLLFP